MIILSARYGVMTAIRKAEQRDVSNQTDQDELGSREDLEAYGSQQFTPGGSGEKASQILVLLNCAVEA